jgi:hypothetical protein
MDSHGNLWTGCGEPGFESPYLQIVQNQGLALGQVQKVRTSRFFSKFVQNKSVPNPIRQYHLSKSKSPHAAAQSYGWVGEFEGGNVSVLSLPLFHSDQHQHAVLGV